MGWKDNCPECGGHKNKEGSFLHKPACSLASRKEIVTQVNQTTMIPTDPFNIGVLRNLTLIETRSFYTGSPPQTLTYQMVMNRLDDVLARFPCRVRLWESDEVFIIQGVLEDCNVF